LGTRTFEVTGLAGGGWETGYNLHMLLAVLLIHVMEFLFFAGLAGSAVVVLISFAQDAAELFGSGEENTTQPING